MLLAEPGLHLQLPVHLASRLSSPTGVCLSLSRMTGILFGLIFRIVAPWPIVLAKCQPSGEYWVGSGSG